MVKRILNKWDAGLIQKVGGAPRIVGYNNKCDFFSLGIRKGELRLEITVFPLDNDNERIFLSSLGFDPTNCYSKYATEQFNIRLSEEQGRTLLKELEKRLK
jgi:hypothetical protein